ncbi:aromatic-ring-hydroxylating dioxygenase subunit beta [Oscillatoria sp. FACHB-1407]|uniref:aromatic-ring-hydroxylating dioxygenase subunit beta n=1 Tax=Oscillatoria sp. FACHB-1407 TaxID=2692847 RepID=UPI0016846574|nr:aromatic-ring-hydroxylating dioxygenase subunit beta [Oscillatoria sp. FACHB-1407]MBD2465752.1 aromatic-ring-hydroxylating dioxygenase subunit beta [Oscillatoria sp. FACHB-1407]
MTITPMIVSTDTPTYKLVDEAIYLAIQNLEFAYARSLDTFRLDEWVNYFADDCAYKVIPRENVERGLPVGVIFCNTKGMLRDRVRSIQEANIYNIHYPRHCITNIEVLSTIDGVFEVYANYVVYQTDQEGQTRLFSVGQYHDHIVFVEGVPKFQSKVVIVDTFSIPNLLAIPL